MITGAHPIIYTVDPEADRAFFRDVLKLPSIDADGAGWLIFGLPPSEVAFHPSGENGKHELYLLCDDIDEFVSWAADHDVPCSPIDDKGWGRLVEITLPGGGGLGVYQPLHERPPAP